MSGATIIIECLICDDSLSTSRVEDALAFDRLHTALHLAPAGDSAVSA